MIKKILQWIQNSQWIQIILKFLKKNDSAWLAKGVKFFGSTKSEKSFEKNKRSIFAIKDIEKGEKFTKENIRVLRPRVGLVPLFYDKILGKKLPKI